MSGRASPASSKKRGRAAPVPHRDPAMDMGLPPVPVTKAYRNEAFLNSSHARHIRILAEYEETMQRLKEHNVKATVMFFGSARSKDRDQHAKALVETKATLGSSKAGSEEHAAATTRLERLESAEWMCEYMDMIRSLSRRITQWGVDRTTEIKVVSGVSRNSRKKAEEPAPADDASTKAGVVSVHICTGGGPGFMEAANRGASEVVGGKTIGMGITLPFEAGLNPYVTPELAFEYHYFFTRKFWMAYHMQALVVAPGGFGTMDELFELMTLKQTGKMQRNFPIVLIGKKYWLEVINWKALAKYGVISMKEVDELLMTDDMDEAFAFVTKALTSSIAEIDAPIVDAGSMQA